MISIPAPDNGPKPRFSKTKFKLDKLVWDALCVIAAERKRSPEEMITIWVDRYIAAHDEQKAQQRPPDKQPPGIVIP